MHECCKTYASRTCLVKTSEKEVVHDVSLALRRGELLGLLGPNGAGKTTLMRLLVGNERPSNGQVRCPQTPVLQYTLNSEHSFIANVMLL